MQQFPSWHFLLPSTPIHGSDGYPSTKKTQPPLHMTPHLTSPQRALSSKEKRLANASEGEQCRKIYVGWWECPWEIQLRLESGFGLKVTKTSLWLSCIPDRPVGQSACLADQHCPGWQQLVPCSAGALRLGSSLRAHSSRYPS